MRAIKIVKNIETAIKVIGVLLAFKGIKRVES